MLDPNIRPGFITDRARLSRGIDAMIAQADIVKLSDEDLHWLRAPATRPTWRAGCSARGPRAGLHHRRREGRDRLLPRGDGPRRRRHRSTVVDTVGAGDTFNAGVLAGLARAGALTRDARRARSTKRRSSAALDLGVARPRSPSAAPAPIRPGRTSCEGAGPARQLRLGRDRRRGGRRDRPGPADPGLRHAGRRRRRARPAGREDREAAHLPDEGGKMNRSLLDTGGAALVVSQFTLAADTRAATAPASPPPRRRTCGRRLTTFAARCRPRASRSPPAASAPTWRWARQRRPGDDLAGQRGLSRT